MEIENVALGKGFAKNKWLPVLVLILLVLAGGWLAVHRIFQVDEVQTMHMAWLLTRPDAASYVNSAEVYMIPMGLLSRAFEDPFHYMVACRLIFYGIFLVSCVILVRSVVGAGSMSLVAGLCLLGTMPVLWDYGFEVRHDTLVALGLSCLIWMLMKGQTPVRLLFGAGVLCGFLIFSSAKSVVLWAPILALIILSAATGGRSSWIRALTSTAGGLIVAVISVLLLHGLMGSLPLYLKTARSLVNSMGDPGIRFFNWSYAWRFARHHPWLLTMSVLFVVHEGRLLGGSLSNLRAGKGLDARIKTFFLLLLGPAFLALNPTPFPYNYVYLIVLSFPAVYSMTTKLFEQSFIRPSLVLSMLVIIQAVAAVPQMIRHFGYLNGHQHAMQTYVNDYTKPRDCVFDGAGLAMFRRGPGFMWYLHSLNRSAYSDGRVPKVREMLADSGCPILAQSYKWEFMEPEDMAFIKARYIPFRGTVWILGCRIIPNSENGSLHFSVSRSGYYLICSWDMTPVRDARVDGATTSARAVFLERGEHQLNGGPPNSTIFALWVKDSHFLPPPVPELPSPIFVNWY